MLRRFNLFTEELEPQKDHPPGFHYRSTRVADAIGGARIGGTVYELDEGERVCPYHYHHAQEEWLYVVSGRPTLRSPDGTRKLRAGDTVCFVTGPEGAHDVCGPGRILILSAQRWPEIPVYPDSDKVGTRPGPWPQHMDDRRNFRRSDSLDYWEGEE